MILCLIYLGSQAPDYVFENLKYLRSTFPDENIWFLGDSDVTLGRAKRQNVNTWRVPDLRKIDSVGINDTNREHFSKDFWFYTLARFYALRAFMSEHLDRSILQVECDVLLSKNFPFDKVSSIARDLAYPLESASAGVPSTFFIRDFSSLTKLLDFFDLEISQGVFLVDMFLLAKYAQQYPSRVHILPSALPSEFSFNPSADEATQNVILSNSAEYDGIFDSTSWGQYLFGIDPNNYLGFTIRYHNQKSHAVNPKIPILSIDSNDNLNLSIGDMHKKVYSLHIHSKNVYLFSQDPKVWIGLISNADMSRLRISFNFKIFVKTFSMPKAKFLIVLFLKKIFYQVSRK